MYSDSRDLKTIHRHVFSFLCIQKGKADKLVIQQSFHWICFMLSMLGLERNDQNLKTQGVDILNSHTLYVCQDTKPESFFENHCSKSLHQQVLLLIKIINNKGLRSFIFIFMVISFGKKINKLVLYWSWAHVQIIHRSRQRIWRRRCDAEIGPREWRFGVKWV